MPRPGFTSKPCPGCGERNERKKDSVCPNCLGLLHTAKKHKELYEKLAAEETFIECQVPYGWGGPSFYLPKTSLGNDQLKQLSECLKNLSRLCSIPYGYKVGYGYMQYLINSASYSYDSGLARDRDLPVVFIAEKSPGKPYKWDWQGKGVMPKEIFDCLNELETTMQSVLKSIESQAIEYGKNALLMLNSGQMTLEDFEKK